MKTKTSFWNVLYDEGDIFKKFSNCFGYLGIHKCFNASELIKTGFIQRIAFIRDHIYT